ncbi:MAG: YezD family protein [Eubacteriales bacterium]|nr:YezD family protein [Eubacteriales bacterium]
MADESKWEKRDENYLNKIKNIVTDIRYGSVNLIIQDGKVIQIDKTEKIRL